MLIEEENTRTAALKKKFKQVFQRHPKIGDASVGASVDAVNSVGWFNILSVATYANWAEILRMAMEKVYKPYGVKSGVRIEAGLSGVADRHCSNIDLVQQ